MADKANSNQSILSVASRASQFQGNCWWPTGLGFAFSVLSFSFAGIMQ